MDSQTTKIAGILSKPEQRSELLPGEYKTFQRSSDLELTTLGVVPHYNAKVKKTLKTGGIEQRTHKQRRECKRNR